MFDSELVTIIYALIGILMRDALHYIKDYVKKKWGVQLPDTPSNKTES